MSDAHNRQTAARAWLDAQGLDAIIAFNDGQNSFLDAHATFVFSGFRPLGESALIIPRDGDVVLICAPAWDAERARAMATAGAVLGADHVAAGLLAALKKAGLLRGKLAAVALAKQRRGLANVVLAALAHAPRQADTLAADIARIRSPQELEYSRKATWIAERGYEAMLKAAKPGVREFELAAELHTFMKGIGAEDNFLLMSASQHNHAVRAAGRRVLEEGDIILGEITPCYRGQFAQICRTAVLGEPPTIVAEKYELLKRAMLRGMEAATPGATVKQATEAMNDVLREAGYGDYCRPPYMRVRGHGLGITSDRPGDLHDASDVKFEEGMVFVMHPNQYIPETGYLMCGDTVVISHNGAISLAEGKCDLDILGCDAMQTTHPSIMLGSFLWDEERAPRDEYDIRLAPLRESMARENLAAILIYGDGREHRDLAFFTNYIPRMRWTMAVLPAKGSERLLISMSSRDMPAQRSCTWVGDLKSGWEWKWFDEMAAQWPPDARVGAIGLNLMTPILFAQLEKSLGERKLVALDEIALRAREKHRPREIAMMRASAGIAELAAAAIERAWAEGKDIETAAIAGERVARQNAAHDVRTLVSRDGGRTLSPYDARFDDRPDRLCAYVAVKYLGYWSERFVALQGDSLFARARANLDAMLAAFKPGATAGDLARLADPLHDALQGAVGHRIGLAANEGDDLRGEALVKANVVYALRACALDEAGRAGFAGAMAFVRPNGKLEILSRD